LANSAIVGILRAILTANTAEFDTALKRSSESAKVWSRDLKSVGQQATQLGASLTKTLTLPIAGSGAAIAKVAIDFESSFAGIRKTVDATEPEFKAMEQQFRNLAKQIPVNVNELNRLGEAAGALGVPKAEIVDFARVMALLGVTTNVTSDQAAESIAQIQTIFKAAGKDTDRFASTLVHLGNNGASTEAQILELANRMASAGNAIGLSQKQVLGFSSAMANVGINAEAGGTAISKVFSDISIAVSKNNEKLAQFAKQAGVSTTEFARRFKEDAAGAVTAFIEGIGKAQAQGQDLNLILDQLGFKEARQARALRDLALSGTNLADSLKIANDGWTQNSALTTEANERFKTVASQLTLLWNRIKDVGITLGNALLPAIKSAISLVTAFIPYLEMMAKGFAAMPGGLQMVVIGLLGVAAAVGPLIYTFGQVAISAGALAQAFTKQGIAMRAVAAAAPIFATAMKLAMGEVGIFIAGLALLTAGFVKLEQAAANRKLQNQVAGAQQDVINRAIAQGADQNIKYAEALAYNNNEYRKLMERGKEFKNEQQRLNGANEALTDGLSDLNAQLESAQGKINQLSADTKQKLVTAIKSGAFSMEELAEKSGLGDVAMKLFADQVEASGKKAAQAEKKIDDLGDKLAELSKAASEGGMSVAKAHALYGSEIESTVKKAKIMGVEIPQNLRIIAAAYDDSLTPAIEAFKKALDDVHKSLFDTAKIQRDTMLEGIIATAQWSEDTTKLTRDAEFAKVDAIENARDEAIASLRPLRDTNKKVYDQMVADIRSNAAKRIAIVLGANQTEGEALDELGFKTKAQLDDIAEAARNTYIAVANDGERSAEAVQEAWENYRRAEIARMGPFARSMSELLRSIPTTIIKALVGGGGLAGAATAIGTDFGTRLGNSIVGSLAKNFPKFMASQLGAMLGDLIPVVGSLIGPLISKILSKFGPSKAELEGRQRIGEFEKDLASQLTDNQKKEAAGRGWAATVIAVRDAYLATGRTVEEAQAAVTRLWQSSKKGAAETEAAIEVINGVLNEQKDIQERIAGLNDDLTGALNAAKEFGMTLPGNLQASIQKLIDMGRITGDNIALFESLKGEAEFDFKKMESVAEKFGVDLSGLGGKFQQAKLNARVQEIVDAFDTLERGGADVNVVLDGMKDEINKVVQDSLKFGTTIPENMRPWIEKLQESGELVDENGDKIEDIGDLKFAEPLKTEFQKIIDKLQELIDRIAGPLTDAIDDATKDRTVKIGVVTKSGGMTGGGTGEVGVVDAPEASYGWRGGMMTPQGLKHMIGGGWVGAPRITAPFKWPSIGRDVHPAMLAEGEFVLDHQRLDSTVKGLEAGVQMTKNLAAAISNKDGSEDVLRALYSIESAIMAKQTTSVELEGRELARVVHRAWDNGGAVRTEAREILGVGGA
jgi:TP901 family phage tail tape measure protein